jgi:capsular exopolysaccharide synthesis family protein
MLEEDTTARANSDTFELVLRALRKHWVLVAVVWVAVFASVAFYTVGQKRIYRAAAVIQIEPTPPRPLGEAVQAVVDVGNLSYWDNKEYYLTQIEILRGMALAHATAQALGLNTDLAFINNLPTGKLPVKGAKPVTLDVAAAVLQSRFSAELVKDSRLVHATLDDASPERARRILSTLLDIYLERNVGRVVSSSAEAGEWLRGQTEKLKNELESSELALYNYKKDKRILSVSLDDQSNMLRGEMQQLSAALTTVKARRENLMARLHELETVRSDDPTVLPAAELLASPILTSLRQEYSVARGALESALGSGKGENHPEVEALRAKAEATKQSLVAEIKNVQGALRSELAAVTEESKGISSLFEQAKQRAFELNSLEIEYRRLERSKNNTEKLFGLVIERSKESDLTSRLRFNNISVVEPANAGEYPIKPRVPANLALGLIFGLVLGLSLAVGVEWYDRTLRSPQDVEIATGLPLLGLLPIVTGTPNSSGYYSRRTRKNRGKTSSSIGEDVPAELIAHALPASNAAECARGIRTSLSFESPDKPHKTILVTSAAPSEGKTTVASTIAVTFAQTGQRVLIMDCDLRRSRLHRVFKCNNAAGVTSVLLEPSSLDKALVKTEVGNLSLLPAGPYVPNPAELLQSASFGRILETLSTKFDRIIIDSPPVLVVTDATILCGRVDTSVLVFRSGKTKRDVAKQVLRKLSGIGARISGVVLNAMDEPKSKRGYYSGYYSKEDYQPSVELDAKA